MHESVMEFVAAAAELYALSNAHNEEDRELCVSRLEAWEARGCG